MILKKLEIKLNMYGPHEGQYTGEARFDGGAGGVALSLTPKHCEQIFQVCADGIIDVAKDAARNLTCAVIEQQKSLEQPHDRI